jgi:hypothetical protein
MYGSVHGKRVAGDWSRFCEIGAHTLHEWPRMRNDSRPTHQSPARPTSQDGARPRMAARAIDCGHDCSHDGELEPPRAPREPTPAPSEREAR